MTEPILTVLMTVYNGEPYLKDAVESILNQTYSNFHFLILDNASTDNSREIIRDFKDSRIELVELIENIGQTAALNRGLKLINTPLVARLDADDISFNNRLELQIAFMEKHPSVALLGTAFQTIDGNGDLIAHYHPPTTHQEIIDSFTSNNQIVHSSVVFRYLPVHNLGGYPEDYIQSQDLALWQRLSLKYQVENLPIELIKIRKQINQMRPKGYSGEEKIWIQEGIDLRKEILTHPDISTKAKKRGRYYLMQSELAYYTIGMEEDKHKIARLRKVVKIILYHPILFMKNILINMLLSFFGPSWNSILNGIKNKLHFIIPFKVLSKLNR